MPSDTSPPRDAFRLTSTTADALQRAFTLAVVDAQQRVSDERRFGRPLRGQLDMLADAPFGSGRVDSDERPL